VEALLDHPVAQFTLAAAAAAADELIVPGFLLHL